MTTKQKTQSLLDKYSCFLEQSVNDEIHNACNFYFITNTVTIVRRGDLTKETHNF